MPKRRSRLELYLEVLRVISKGVNKPTNIMYKCNLSWANSREILDSLTEQNMITMIKNKNKRLYMITDKGINLLEYFSKAQELLDINKRRKQFFQLR